MESVKYYVSDCRDQKVTSNRATISHMFRLTGDEVSMVVASGYLEVNGIHNVGKIVNELKRREIGINDIEEGRIVFYMERENIEVIKSEIALLKGIEDVRSVHLTYYSVEDR